MKTAELNTENKKSISLTIDEVVFSIEKEGLKVSNVFGDRTSIVTHIATLDNPSPNALCFCKEPYLDRAKNLSDCTVLLKEKRELEKSVNQIIVNDPKLAFIIMANIFHPRAETTQIHPTVVIEENCKIGEGTIITANSVIGALGQNFGWGPDGRRWVMPQMGGVSIGKNCFIGSNVTIVRGTINDTVLEDDVWVAHGSQIGHNVHIGHQAFLANNVTVAGSAEIGEHCWIGSGAVIKNKVRLAPDILVGCGAVVVQNFEKPGITLVGVPARRLVK